MRLTTRLKTVTLNSLRIMDRPLRPLLFAVVLAAGCALFLGGCASAGAPSQLKFGLWAAERNLWDEAIFRWRKALEADPRSVSAHNNLAVAYERKGLFNEALKEYEAALKLDPDNSYVKSNYQSCKENVQPAAKPGEPKKDADAKK